MLSLVYGETKKLKIAQIEVDVSVQETHETDTEISENPIERGQNITDHIQIKPAQLTIEGLVSDTPIKFAAGLRGLDDNRSRKTYEELLALQRAREPFDVVTGLKLYKNMVLKTLTVPRSVDTGKALKFTAVLQEIIILDPKNISVAVPAQYRKKENVGKVTPEPPAAKTADDNASWARSGARGAAQTFFGRTFGL